VCKAFLDPQAPLVQLALRDLLDRPVPLAHRDLRGFKVCPDRLVPQEAPAPQDLLGPSALRDHRDLKV
jgi:hypothetical protein